jgi:hypothetical protein
VALQFSRDIGKHRIRVSSSEILDGILREVSVKVEQRHKVLKILASFDKKPWSTLKTELIKYVP